MKYHKRGLLIGPQESLSEFEERADIKAQSTFPKCLKKIFAISPDWVSVEYKNKGLRLWEGGCSWIDASGATIQLRRSFEKKKKLWGIYSKQELLAHEGVHAARVAFDEPIFEEVLAYQTSTSLFRRYFGPIFRSSKESLIFMSVLFFSLLFQPLLIVSASLLIFGVTRLFITQKRFTQAKKELSKIFGEKNACPIMLHLTDKEIIQFARVKTIIPYIREQDCGRWKQIKHEFDVESYSQFQVHCDI